MGIVCTSIRCLMSAPGGAMRGQRRGSPVGPRCALCDPRKPQHRSRSPRFNPIMAQSSRNGSPRWPSMPDLRIAIVGCGDPPTTDTSSALTERSSKSVCVVCRGHSRVGRKRSQNTFATTTPNDHTWGSTCGRPWRWLQVID